MATDAPSLIVIGLMVLAPFAIYVMVKKTGSTSDMPVRQKLLWRMAGFGAIVILGAMAWLVAHSQM